MMASAGISHIVVPVHGTGEAQLVLPVALGQFVFRQLERRQPLHELGLENVAGAVESVAGEPDELVLGEPERARVIELVGELALVHDVGESHRRRPVDELEGHLELRMHLPDHLEHQKLVEVRIEQRADRWIDTERMIIDAGCDIRGHYASLMDTTAERQERPHPGAKVNEQMSATADASGPTHKPQPRVGLFVTCLVDIIRPSVGFAAVKLLEDAGCKVVVPSQTCCGQPAYNAGDRGSAKRLARQAIDAFEDCDYVVAPSGSCGGMLIKHYPDLFAGEPELAERAERFAGKAHELISFLVDVMGVDKVEARYEGTVAYHNSCAGLRELGVKAQPRRLLAGVEGLTLVELKEAETCCGFGGLFATKYGELSNAIVARKADDIRGAKPDTVLAGDLGCLMNMAGKLQREGSPVKARHVAEILAGMADGPAIGEGKPEAAR